MGLGEKIADYVGKWLLICIGIITSIIAFTNAFKIRCNLAVIISVTICVVALFLLLVRLKHKYIIISIIAALLVGSVFLLHHELKIGILLCANQVIKAYMNYFDASAIGTFSIHFKSSDWVHNATQASTLLCVFVIIEYAYILVTATWYKVYPNIHLIFSLIFVVSGMAFGKVPNTVLMTVIIFYYFACMMFKGNRKVYLPRMGILMGLILVSLGLILLINNPSGYSSEAKNEKFKKKMDRVINKMNLDNMTIKGIKNIFKNDVMTTGGVDGGTLGDIDEIKFSGQTMLEISIDKIPVNNIYLKGYVANEYNKDNWQGYTLEHKTNYYDSFSGREDYDPFGYTNDLLGNIPNLSEININIYNKHAGTEYMYYPYFSDIKVEKSKFDLMPDTDHKNTHEYEFFDSSWKELMNYYNMDTADRNGEWRYVNKVSTSIPADDQEAFDELFPDAPRYDESKESMVACIEYVKNYLDENTRYSLHPGKIDKKADYVLDFLMERKKGYCTAYASSAVLMYRYMGIPARYVEGYVVSKSDIIKSKENNGKFELKITDASAHAWAEIYIPSIGFVPVENTPGYSNIEYNRDPDKISTEPNTTENRTTKPADETTTSNQGQTTVIHQTQENTKPGIKTKGSENDKNVFVIYIVISSVVLILLISVLLYYRHLSKTRNNLDYNTDDNRYNILVLLQIFTDELSRYSVSFSLDQSNQILIEDIRNIYLKKQSKLSEEKQKNFIIPDEQSIEEILKIFKKAKFANENAQFTKEECGIIRQYVQEFKNSLQYSKNRL